MYTKLSTPRSLLVTIVATTFFVGQANARPIPDNFDWGMACRMYAIGFDQGLKGLRSSGDKASTEAYANLLIEELDKRGEAYTENVGLPLGVTMSTTINMPDMVIYDDRAFSIFLDRNAAKTKDCTTSIKTYFRLVK